MDNYEAMIQIIKDMERISLALDIPPFSIYFLGGSACILGKYNNRATRDFDLIDLNYPAIYGKALRYLNSFDLLEYESTILSPTYRVRATRLEQFNYLQIYVLSREDIIVSKIIRMEAKDLEDMDVLMESSSKVRIREIINEVLERNDLFESKKQAFLNNLPSFRERYHV